MKVMTTQGGVRTTGASNKSSTGADEENRNSDGNPHPGSGMSMMEKYAVSPEWSMSRGNSGGIEGGAVAGPRDFKGSDAAHEDMCRHPSKEYDPASIKISGSSQTW